MNKKGFELAISTLILLVLGILILVALIVFFTGGFEAFERVSNPLIETAEGAVLKESCDLACSTENKIYYCCEELQYKEESLKCDDSRIGVDGGNLCVNVNCEGN